jgi:hypothetical protein
MLASVAAQVQAFALAGGRICLLGAAAQAELKDLLGEYRPSASRRRLHVLRLPRLEREIQAHPDRYSHHVAILDDRIVSAMISSVWQSDSDVYLTPPPPTVHLDALASFSEGTGAGTALVCTLAQQGLRIQLFSLAQSGSFYDRLGGRASYRYRNRRNIGRDFHFLDEAIATLGAAARPWFGAPLPVLDTLAGLTVSGLPVRARSVPPSPTQSPDALGSL